METTWRWVAVTAIAPLAWGSTYFVTRQFLPADAPLWGSAIRALPAGTLLALTCRTRPRGSWWWRSVVLGALNMSAFFALVYVAAQLLPTSAASVIMAISPVAMMTAAFVLVAERPTAPAAFGACLGIAGVCAMTLTGAERLDVRGVLASVAAMTMSSVGYVLAKRWTAQVPVIASTSWQLLAGGLLLVPLAAAVEGRPPAVDAAAVAGFAYVSVVATAVAFAAWFGGLRHLPAGRVGIIGLLNPVAGVLLGTIAASETLTGRQLGGVALVLTGVALGQRPRRSPPT